MEKYKGVPLDLNGDYNFKRKVYVHINYKVIYIPLVKSALYIIYSVHIVEHSFQTGYWYHIEHW